MPGIDADLARTLRLLVDTLSPTAQEEDSTKTTMVSSNWELPNPFGRFNILEQLGHGAFGTVWKAFDPNTKRYVALKVLHPELRGVPNLSQRFVKEAYAAARLNHPNIIRVHEAGTIEGIGFIATEFVEGAKLITLAEGQPQHSLREAAEIAMQLASAVQHSHQHGVLHRDIKPDNVLIERLEGVDGSQTLIPRLMDFGLARLQDERGELSAIGMTIGTLDYMSPEQLSGDPALIGPAADIYAIGLLLFEMLTGRHARQCQGSVLRAIEASRQIVQPRSLRREVPADLDAICKRCLALKPEDRFESAASLHRDLENFLEGRPTETRPRRLHERIVGWVELNRTFAVAATAVVTSILAVLSLSLYHGRELKLQNRRLLFARQTTEAAKILAQQHEASYRQLAWNSGMQHAYNSYEKGNLTAALRQINALQSSHPESTEYPEWTLLKAEIDHCFQVLFEAGFALWGLAPIPGTPLIALGGNHPTVTIFDLQSLRVVKRIDTTLLEVHALAASPDGRYLAVGGFDRRKGERTSPLLIELANDQIKELNAIGTTTIESLSFSPAGDYLAVGFRYEDLQIVSMVDNQTITKIAASRRARNVAWTARNETIVHSLHEMITIVSPQGESRHISIPEDLETFDAHAQSGRLLVSLGRHGCRVVSTATGTVLAELEGGQAWSQCVVLSPDGQWAVSGGLDGSITLWELPELPITTAQDRVPLIYPFQVKRLIEGAITSLCWSDGALIVAGDGGQLIRWRPDNDQVVSQNGLYITTAAFDGTNCLLGFTDGSVRRFKTEHMPTIGEPGTYPLNLEQGEIVHPPSETAVAGIAVEASEHTLFIRFADGSLKRLTREGSELTSLRYSRNEPDFLVKLDARGNYVALTSDGNELYLLDAKTLQELACRTMPSAIYDMKLVEHQSKLVAIGQFEGARILDLPRLDPVATYGVNQGAAILLDSYSEILYSGHSDGVIRSTVLSTGELQTDLQTNDALIQGFSQAWDSRLGISIDSDTNVVLSRPDDQLVFGRLYSVPEVRNVHTHSAMHCEFSSDGQYVFVLQLLMLDKIAKSVFRLYAIHPHRSKWQLGQDVND